MAQVAPWWTVRLACRYALVRVPTRRPPPRSSARQTGSRYGPAPPALRAHFSPKNRTRRVSARHSAVKTGKNGAFRYSKKSRAVFAACERSEVLTARQCRALQSHAVFWEMRHKNVEHRLNDLSRRYGQTGSTRANRVARSARVSACGGLKPEEAPRIIKDGVCIPNAITCANRRH